MTGLEVRRSARRTLLLSERALLKEHRWPIVGRNLCRARSTEGVEESARSPIAQS